MTNAELLFTTQKPVDVTKFKFRFKEKYRKWGACISKKLKENWGFNCAMLNYAINHPKKIIKYVVPAPTGSAKTENLITYCSMLPEDIQVLICTGLIDEANNIVSKINEEANKYIAFPHHSQLKSSDKDAVTAQILVTTHAFYKNNYAGSDIWNLIVKNRDLIVIDEALDTMNEISVEDNDIARAILIFSKIAKSPKYKNLSRFKKELEWLKQDLATLDNFKRGTSLLTSDKVWKLSEVNEILSLKLNKYKLLLEIVGGENIDGDTNTTHNKYGKKLKYSYILTGIDDKSIDNSIRENIKETIINLNELKDRQVYITANKGNKSFNRVTDMMPNKPVVCFDATASINKVYSLRAKYYNDIDMVDKLEGIRNYSKVTMHKVRGKTGKQDISIKVATDIFASVKLGKKTLIITHKKNKAFFEQVAKDKHPKKTVEVAHWNAITGLNTWHDFDTCIVAGLNHKPRYYTQNRVIINTDTEQTAFGTKQNHFNTEIGKSSIIAEIIQAINRIRVRKVIDENGNCDKANIYIILPAFLELDFKRDIQQEMPNIKIKEWKLKSGIVTEGQSHFNTLINYLSDVLQDGEKIDFYEPRHKLNINKNAYKSMIGSGEKYEEFKRKLHDYGFEIIESSEGSRGRKRTKYPKKYFHKIGFLPLGIY